MWWDSRLLLREMDQKTEFGRTNGSWDAYLDFLFRHLEIYRLDANLNDAAGALQAQSGKGPANVT